MKKPTLTNVLILGANSALATELARQLAPKVESLNLVARDTERLKILSQDLHVRGARRVECFVCDFADQDAEEKIADWLQSQPYEIDTAFLAHGILGDQSTLEKNPRQARDLVNVNFSSYVGLGLVLAEQMAKHSGGQIVILSSVAGERGKQSNCVYSATMAGRTVFADGLRHRYWKKGVNVITIKLGPFESPMTAHMRKGALWISAETAATQILRVVRKNGAKAFIPGIWQWIMWVIRQIPESVFLKTGL